MELAARIMKFHDFMKVSTFDDFILFHYTFLFRYFLHRSNEKKKMNWKLHDERMLSAFESSFVSAVKAIARFR